MRSGAGSTAWAGVSLSKQKPSPSWPIRRSAARTRNEPRFRRRPRRFAPTWQHGRVQRIGRKRVHHICHQQLLVLLFVVQTKLDDGQRLVGQSCDCAGQRGIDMATIVGDLRGGWAGQ